MTGIRPAHLLVAFGCWLIVGAANAGPALAAPTAVSNTGYLGKLWPAAQAKARTNTGQWIQFRTRLDRELGRVTTASYQADHVVWASDYALAYRLLRDSDGVAASHYADKAIAVLLSALRDNVRNTTGSRMFLGRGDGHTTSFALPHSAGAIRVPTFKVWLAPIKVKEVTKGAANGQDEADYYHHFLKVSLTPDGPADFVKGTDWRVNADCSDNAVDWSLPGAEPDAGTKYYVSEATTANTQPESRGLRIRAGADGTLVFAGAPRADQAIFVEYQYEGTPSGGSAPLKYQQTGDGRGGWNNVRIDSGYTSRSLKYAAVALDWLWDYPGLSPSIREEASSMLVRWSDELRDKGYYRNSPASNYGAGHYGLRMATAVALRGRSAAAPRLEAEMRAYRRDNVLPQFEKPKRGSGTLYGGFWPEGWNYGAQAVRNIIVSGLAYESAGWGLATEERAWACQVIEALLLQQPTKASVYEGGDGYAWPLPFPDKQTVGTLAHAASDARIKSYAHYTLQQYRNAASPTGEDLLLRDPVAPAAFWGEDLPRHHLAQGVGLAVARKDWNYDSTWLSFHCGNLAPADHQSLDQGALSIHRGADALLVIAPSVGGLQAPAQKSQFSNLVVIDDGGAGEQTYRFNQGVWYGEPGVSMLRFEGADAYAYFQGDYAAAYRKNTGQSNPVNQLVRSVFYVRGPDYVIVHDRVTTSRPEYVKQLRWHFLDRAAVSVDDSKDTWSVAVGSSCLFGRTFSEAAVVTSLNTVRVGSASFKQVATNNASAVADVRYVTAIQVSSSTTRSMDEASWITSKDGQLAGVRIRSYVVLFGRATLSGGTAYEVAADAGAKLTHHVTDLRGRATYTLDGAEQAAATASSEGVLTFTTIGTGATQSVALTAAAR